MAISVTPTVCETVDFGLGRGSSNCCADAAATCKTSRAAAGTATRAMSFFICALLFGSGLKDERILLPIASIDHRGGGLHRRRAAGGEVDRRPLLLLVPGSRRLH